MRTPCFKAFEKKHNQYEKVSKEYLLTEKAGFCQLGGFRDSFIIMARIIKGGG